MLGGPPPRRTSRVPPRSPTMFGATSPGLGPLWIVSHGTGYPLPTNTMRPVGAAVRRDRRARSDATWVAPQAPRVEGHLTAPPFPPRDLRHCPPARTRPYDRTVRRVRRGRRRSSLPPLGELLRRFRFLGVPGAPASAAVPVDRGALRAAELAPVLAALQAAEGEAAGIVARAEQDAARTAQRGGWPSPFDRRRGPCPRRRRAGRGDDGPPGRSAGAIAAHRGGSPPRGGGPRAPHARRHAGVVDEVVAATSCGWARAHGRAGAHVRSPR